MTPSKIKSRLHIQNYWTAFCFFCLIVFWGVFGSKIMKMVVKYEIVKMGVLAVPAQYWMLEQNCSNPVFDSGSKLIFFKVFGLILYNLLL